MSLRERVRALQHAKRISEDSTKSTGLLHRLHSIRARKTMLASDSSDSTSTSIAEFNPWTIISKIQAKLRNYKPGIDIPYIFFEVLQTVFTDFEGILLLPQQYGREALIPACASPKNRFDFNQIMIPQQKASKLHSTYFLQNTDNISGNEELLSLIPKPMLSFSSAPSGILLIPCGLNGGTGLLIINNCEILRTTKKKRTHMSSLLSDVLQNLIEENRSAIFKHFHPSSNKEFNSQLIHETRAQVLFFSIEKRQLEKTFKHHLPSIWDKYIYQDCMKIFESIVQEDGTVFEERNAFYISISNIVNINYNLIILQIQSAFKQVFSLPTIELSLIKKDMSDLRKLLSNKQYSS